MAWPTIDVCALNGHSGGGPDDDVTYRYQVAVGIPWSNKTRIKCFSGGSGLAHRRVDLSAFC